MTQSEREALLRDYAACQITWRELQERGFTDYIEVLGGLGELGLRPPMARMIGPNVEARQRGLALLRRALDAQIKKEQAQKQEQENANSKAE